MICGKLHQGLLLPDGAIAREMAEHIGRKYKKTSIDESAVALGLFFEAHDLPALNIQRTKTTGWVGRSECGIFAVTAVESDGGADIDIAHAIAIGEAKRFVVFDVFGHPAQAPACHGCVACVNQRDRPGLGAFVVHLHLVEFHAEGDIRHVQEVVGKVFFDEVALVATADHKVVDAVMGVHLEDVP